jgi:uncharacterized membrane protein YbhN (UPF0104 family)
MTTGRDAVKARPGWRRRVGFYARILASAVALALVVRLVSGREIMAALAGADLRWILVALGCVALDRVVMAGKWRILLAAQGLVHSLGELVRVYFVATFYGSFLPTGVGGDVIRIMQVSRGPERGPAVTASVVMERVLGLIATAVLVAVTTGGFVLGRRPDLEPFLGLAFAAVLLGIGGLAFALHGPWHERLPGPLARFALAFRVYSGRWGALARFFGWSFLEQLIPVVAVYSMAMALGYELGFPVFLLVIPLDLFVSRIPISVDAIGIREGLYVALFGQAGLGASEAFLLALVGRVVTLVGLLPGCFLRARAGGVAPVAPAG